MRINLTLNDNNERDKTIIDFLNTRYSACSYIKELLYQVAKGNNISFFSNSEPIQQITVNQEQEPKQEYEEIENLNDIDL